MCHSHARWAFLPSLLHSCRPLCLPSIIPSFTHSLIFVFCTSRSSFLAFLLFSLFTFISVVHITRSSFSDFSLPSFLHFFFLLLPFLLFLLSPLFFPYFRPPILPSLQFVLLASRSPILPFFLFFRLSVLHGSFSLNYLFTRLTDAGDVALSLTLLKPLRSRNLCQISWKCDFLSIRSFFPPTVLLHALTQHISELANTFMTIFRPRVRVIYIAAIFLFSL